MHMLSPWMHVCIHWEEEMKWGIGMKSNSSQFSLCPLTPPSLIHILVPNLPCSCDTSDHVSVSGRPHHAGGPNSNLQTINDLEMGCPHFCCFTCRKRRGPISMSAISSKLELCMHFPIVIDIKGSWVLRLPLQMSYKLLWDWSKTQYSIYNIVSI